MWLGFESWAPRGKSHNSNPAFLSLSRRETSLVLTFGSKLRLILAHLTCGDLAALGLVFLLEPFRFLSFCRYFGEGSVFGTGTRVMSPWHGRHRLENKPLLFRSVRRVVWRDYRPIAVGKKCCMALHSCRIGCIRTLTRASTRPGVGWPDGVLVSWAAADRGAG